MYIDRRSTTALSMKEAQASQWTRAVSVTDEVQSRQTCNGMVSWGRTSADIMDSVETGRWADFGQSITIGRRFERLETIVWRSERLGTKGVNDGDVTACGSVYRTEKRCVHESKGCIRLARTCTYNEPNLLGKKKKQRVGFYWAPSWPGRHKSPPCARISTVHVMDGRR